MDSLFESMIDPAERRRTQNRLAKRKSRTHARKPGTEAPELLAMSQPVEAPKSEEPGARETGNAAVGHHTTSSFASSSSTQLPTMVSPSVVSGHLTANRSTGNKNIVLNHIYSIGYCVHAWLRRPPWGCTGRTDSAAGGWG